MPRCKGNANASGVFVEALADPCPWRSGSGCTHFVEIYNTNPTSLLQVQITLTCSHNQIEFDGARHYKKRQIPEIKAGATYRANFRMTALPGHSGKHEDICTVIEYRQTSDKETMEGEAPLLVSYEIGIP